MAPEQLPGQDLDPRADLYATGAVLFECVTGRNVFLAPNLMAMMAKHLEEAPEDPRNLNPEVPAALSQVILKALAKQARAALVVRRGAAPGAGSGAAG